MELSRHVTVHQADLNRYTAENAVVAVVLAASVVRALQEHYEAVDRGQPSRPCPVDHGWHLVCPGGRWL